MRDLGLVVRAVAMSAIVLATVIALCATGARQSANQFSASTAIVVCQTAADRLAHGTPADAANVFDAAGVTAENFRSLPRDCEKTWRTVQQTRDSTPDAGADDACAEAAALLGQGLFVTARARLAAQRVTSANAESLSARCEAVWTLADALVARDEVRTVPAAEVVTRACELAEQRLRWGDAAAAVAILSAGGATASAPPADCIDTWTIATGLSAKSPAEKSAPEQAGGWWDDFVAHFSAPLVAMGAFVLGGWLAQFVVARLLVEAAWLRNLVSSARSRRAAGLLGWGLLILAPLAAVWLGSAAGSGWLAGGWLVPAFLATGALAVVGAFCVAGWLATPRRLELTVGEKSVVGKTAIVEHLNRVASGSTSGNIELRAGEALPDVASALTSISGNAVVQAVQKVVAFLIGLKPWRAVVNATDDATASIDVSRNGRQLYSTTVDLGSPRLARLDPVPDGVKRADILALFIAVEVLFAMREAYAPDFSEGLQGAKKPAGYALRAGVERWYLPADARDQAIALLRYARAVDGEDRQTEATLQNALHRQSSRVDDLLAYYEWLRPSKPKSPEECQEEPAPASAPASPTCEGTPDGAPAQAITAEHDRSNAIVRAAVVRNLAAIVKRFDGRGSDEDRSAADASGGQGEPPPLTDPPRVGPLGQEWAAARAADKTARARLTRSVEVAEQVAALSAEPDERCTTPRHTALRKAKEAAASAAREVRMEVANVCRHAQEALDAGTAADAKARRTDAEAALAKAAAAFTLLEEAQKASLDDYEAIRALAKKREICAALRETQRVLAGLHGGAGAPDTRTSARVLVDCKALTAACGALCRANRADAAQQGITGADAIAAVGLSEEQLAVTTGNPQLAYGLACYLVCWRGVAASDAQVLELFDTAFERDVYVAFAADDPELAAAGAETRSTIVARGRAAKAARDKALKEAAAAEAVTPEPQAESGPKKD